MSQNLFSVSNKVIVVTGATGALAGTAANHLAAQGAKVVFISRSQDKIKAAVAACEEAGNTASGHACDVTDEARLKAVCEAVLSDYGRIDALINGAGGNMPGATIPPGKTVFDLELEDYDRVMNLNLKGTLMPSLIFGKAIVDGGQGSILNFSSASSAQALTRVLGYSNAKAAVDNLTRWMATHLAQQFGDRIRVNAVCPGFFVGDQNRALLLNEDGTYTERGQQIINKTPMGRFGDAEEIAGSIQFLLSDAAKFITGQVVHIDGGFGCFTGV